MQQERQTLDKSRLTYRSCKGNEELRDYQIPFRMHHFSSPFFLCHFPVKDWIGGNRSVCQRVVSPTVISQTSLRSVCKRVEVSSQTFRSQFVTVISQGTQRQFSENIYSEDHLRSRIFVKLMVVDSTCRFLLRICNCLYWGGVTQITHTCLHVILLHSILTSSKSMQELCSYIKEAGQFGRFDPNIVTFV